MAFRKPPAFETGASLDVRYLHVIRTIRGLLKAWTITMRQPREMVVISLAAHYAFRAWYKIGMGHEREVNIDER